MSDEHEVVVRLSFPVSAEKARQVLERWWAQKAARKSYMREFRAGRVGARAKKGEALA